MENQEFYINGETLKKLRDKMLYSEFYVASYLNISPFEYKCIESNSKTISLDQLTILCALFKVDRDILITKTPQKNKQKAQETKSSNLLKYIDIND